jgi:hypothetical protein
MAANEIPKSTNHSTVLPQSPFSLFVLGLATVVRSISMNFKPVKFSCLPKSPRWSILVAMSPDPMLRCGFVYAPPISSCLYFAPVVL